MPKHTENVLYKQYRVMEGIAERYLLSLNELTHKRKRCSNLEEKYYRIMVKEYVKIFERVYDSLDINQKEIIRCVFLKPELIPWIKAQYSPATFYRLRNKSINAFIGRFYA